jgi:hypothetical protein
MLRLLESLAANVRKWLWKGRKILVYARAGRTIITRKEEQGEEVARYVFLTEVLLNIVEFGNATVYKVKTKE